MPPPLGYLLDDDATRARIRAAIAASSTITAAATALGVSYRTLCRWRLEHPDLVPEGLPGRRAHDTNVIAKHRQIDGCPKNHDSAVIAKPAENSHAPETATQVSWYGRPAQR